MTFLKITYRVLTFSTNSFHLLPSLARVFQFGTFIFCISFLTSSPPACLWSSCWPSWYGFPAVNCLYHSRTLHPFNVTSQLSLCARMNFIMFLRFIVSSSSWLVFIRHIPFSLFGLSIFLKMPVIHLRFCHCWHHALAATWLLSPLVISTAKYREYLWDCMVLRIKQCYFPKQHYSVDLCCTLFSGS